MVKLQLCLAAVLLWNSSVRAGDPPIPDPDLRAAVKRALPLIQKGTAGHMAQRTCFACHNQGIPILAMAAARSRGFDVDGALLQKNLDFIARFLDKNRDNYRKGQGQGGQVDTAGYALWTLELGGWNADKTTAAVAEFFLQHNQNIDHWRATANRPPTEASPFTATYLALRSLQTYGTSDQTPRLEERNQKVKGWLLKAPVKDTEDRVFHLWALRRMGGLEKEAQGVAAELLKTQREDGGWAQLDKMKPDAYATGSALVALHLAGDLPTSDPAYQRGLRYLLSTQLSDGTWHVKSRSNPFQLYYESGFPHGKDQFISIAASSWATTALALACPTEKRW